MEHLGLAVFEGEKLLWYAVKKFHDPKTVSAARLQIQQYLAVLVQTYKPEVLVVEEPFYAQSLLSQHLVKITRDIKTWGKLKGLAVRSYTPPEVIAFFCRDQKTKQSLAEAMIEKFPFLRRYLSYLPLRRRYWFHVFDAIGLGLMCAKRLNGEKASPRMALPICA